MPVYLSGDPNIIITCQISNDTGSNIQAMFRSHWNKINYRQTLVTQAILVPDASGAFTNSESVYAELRILGYNSVEGQLYPVTDWFIEQFIVRDDAPNASLLSGAQMRNYLHFATAPGNRDLYVSVKNGIMTKLPVM